MKWIDYREKLGIGFNDSQKYKMLSNIFQNYAENVIGNLYSAESYLSYCQMVGETYWDHSYPYRHLRDSFRECGSIVELIAHFIAFFNTYRPMLARDILTKPITKKDVITFLRETLDNININYEIYEDNDGIFVFPKGAPELDNALVSEPLEWLRGYPTTRKAFVKTLKSYSEATADNASDVADLLRKTLESFFQEFFNSDKSLENLKSQYGTFLSKKGVPSEIANNFEKLLEAYTKFNNNYAKHHDKTSLNVLEYIMYQTGNLIRLLITLNQEDTDAN